MTRAWPRFIREQLAADQFFPEQTHLTAALGFIAAGPLELSRAGTAPVTFDYLDRDDMVTQTMAAFASTTANCARCHDHKFDPITQEDYYSLQAVFAGIGKGDVEFDVDPAVASDRRRWSELLAAVKRDEPSVIHDAKLAGIAAEWEANFASVSATWEPLVLSTFLSSGGATLTRLDDNSIIASDVRPDQDTYTLTSATSLTTLTAIRLDVLADESLPMKGPGRQDNGNLHLTEFEAFVFDPEAEKPTRLKIRKAIADWDQAGWTIAHAIDGDLKTAWGIFPKVGESHHAVFELEKPLQLKPSSQIVVVLKQLHGGGHLIGRLKLYATDADGAAAEVVPESVGSALKVPRDQRSQSNKQRSPLTRYNCMPNSNLPRCRHRRPCTRCRAATRTQTSWISPMTPKVVHVLAPRRHPQPGRSPSPVLCQSSRRCPVDSIWMIQTTKHHDERRWPIGWLRPRIH